MVGRRRPPMPLPGNELVAASVKYADALLREYAPGAWALPSSLAHKLIALAWLEGRNTELHEIAEHYLAP